MCENFKKDEKKLRNNLSFCGWGMVALRKKRCQKNLFSPEICDQVQKNNGKRKLWPKKKVDEFLKLSDK